MFVEVFDFDSGCPCCMLMESYSPAFIREFCSYESGINFSELKEKEIG